MLEELLRSIDEQAKKHVDKVFGKKKNNYGFDRQRVQKIISFLSETVEKFKSIMNFLKAAKVEGSFFDYSILDETYHCLQVPRQGKVYHYHRTLKRDGDGRLVVARYFGAVHDESANKKLEKWREAKEKMRTIRANMSELEYAVNYTEAAFNIVKDMLKELTDLVNNSKKELTKPLEVRP